MSGYPYGGNPPQYPPPQGQIYPQIYNPSNAPPLVQGQPAPGYPMPGHNFQYPGFQPGFGFPYQTGQPAQPGQPPAVMSYTGVGPTAPSAPGYGYPGFPNVTPQPVYGQSVEWISTTSMDAQSLSNRALVAGYEAHDGSPLWVIRASFQGDLIPGKLAVKHNTAYVPWGGKENSVINIEVCCTRPDKVRWVENRDGIIPPNAVVGGNTASGELLYIGRAKEQGSLTPGKVHPSHNAMYISFAGKEVSHRAYEILCTV